MKYIIYCIFFCIFGVFISESGFAQIKYADLEVVINQPSDSTSFSWGDTAKFSFYIQNNGPDTLMINDTASIGFLHFHQAFPLSGVQLDPGDTMQFNNAASLWNDNSAINDTGVFCMSIHIISPDVIDTNSDNDTSCVVYFLNKDNTGIKQQMNQNAASFVIYPNPASNDLFIDFKGTTNKKGDIKILDLTGRVLESEKGVSIGSKMHRINTSGLPSGVFIINLTVNGSSYNQKVVIQK